MIKKRSTFDGYYHFYYLDKLMAAEDRDPLLELLEKRHEGVIHFYLPQLCRLAIERTEGSPNDLKEPMNFGRFISSKSAYSMHFALKADWHFKAIADDKQSDAEHAVAIWLSEIIETAVVNAEVERSWNTAANHGPMEGGSRRVLNRSASKCSIEEPTPQMLEPNLRHRIISKLPHASVIPGEPSLPDSWVAKDNRTDIPLPSDAKQTIATIWAHMEDDPAESCKKLKAHSVEADLIWFLSKQIRCDYFATTGKFCSYLIEISDSLAKEPERSHRRKLAEKCFKKINHWIFCRRSIVAACELTFCMLGFCIPMERIGPDPEIWSETGKELRTDWDDRTVDVVNNPNTEEGEVQHVPDAVQLLRIASKECLVLSSAKRAPYLLVMEVGDLDEDLRDLVNPHNNSESRVSDLLQKCQSNTTTDNHNRYINHRAFSRNSVNNSISQTRDNQPQRPYNWNDIYTYQCVLLDIQKYNLYIPRSMTLPVSRLAVKEARRLAEMGTPCCEVTQPDVKAALADIYDPDPPIDAIRRSLKLFSGPGPDPNTVEPCVPPPVFESALSGMSSSPLSRKVSSPSKRTEPILGPHVDSAQNLNEIPNGYTAETWAPELRRRLWGEPWADKKRRIKSESPFGRLKSWNLHAVLVKGNDDLRQEFLAQQLIRVFRAIFEELGAPLWVRPYEILVTGHDSGIMEFVPDSASFGSLKEKYGNESFARCFEAAFADNLEEAQLNFIHSHAAYSLISYLLNVKDRHNGNLLLLTTGHCIHIDFGFMLSNAPGGGMWIPGGAFEKSAFKLTQEYMDILGGQDSETFEYFKRILTYGFTGARKNAERVLQLVELMQSNAKMPGFSENPQKAVEELKERFMLSLSEEECIQQFNQLIITSINNWRSIQYDAYQKAFNKIW